MFPCKLTADKQHRKNMLSANIYACINIDFMTQNNKFVV